MFNGFKYKQILIIYTLMQSSQGGDPSLESWLGDSRKIGLSMNSLIFVHIRLGFHYCFETYI